MNGRSFGLWNVWKDWWKLGNHRPGPWWPLKLISLGRLDWCFKVGIGNVISWNICYQTIRSCVSCIHWIQCRGLPWCKVRIQTHPKYLLAGSVGGTTPICLQAPLPKAAVCQQGLGGVARATTPSRSLYKLKCGSQLGGKISNMPSTAPPFLHTTKLLPPMLVRHSILWLYMQSYRAPANYGVSHWKAMCRLKRGPDHWMFWLGAQAKALVRHSKRPNVAFNVWSRSSIQGHGAKSLPSFCERVP